MSRVGFGGFALLVLSLAAALVVFTGPERIAGSARAVDAAELSATVLDDLAGLDEVTLSGTLFTEDGAPLRVDIVAGAETTATVTDPGGGVAEFLVAKEVAVKANRAWWLNTVPAYADRLTDKWVQARDDMGFPTGMLHGLSGDSLATLVRDSSADQVWGATPVTMPDGTPALALTTDDLKWTVHVATDGARLLGIEGPIAQGRQKLRGAGPTFGRAQFLVSSTKDCDEATKKKIEETKKKAAEAKPQAEAAPEPPPAPSRTRGPRVSVSIAQTGPCTDVPVCSITATVSNAGDEPAVGVVTVTVQSGGGGTAPVTVPPGGSVPYPFTANNPAAGCSQRCSRTVPMSAFVQVTSMAGPDLGAGSRLNDKGVDPNRPVPAEPGIAGPEITRLMDDLTNGVTAPGFVRDPLVDTVRELLGEALSSKIVSLLVALSGNPAVQRPQQLNEHPAVQLAEQAVNGDTENARAAGVQGLTLLIALASEPDRQPGTLTVRGKVIIDEQRHRAYSVAAAMPDNRTKAEKKSQAHHPDGDIEQRVYDDLRRAIAQFDGAKLDPAYRRTLRFAVNSAIGKYGNAHLGVFKKLLGGEVDGKPVRDLFDDGNGKLKVTDMVIVNGLTEKMPATADYPNQYVLTTEELALLVRRYETGKPPSSSAPTEKSIKRAKVYERHKTVGDAFDPGDPKKAQAGGGHLGGAGVPGKSEYPTAWTAEDIQEAERQVIRTGNTVDGLGNPSPTPRPSKNLMGVTEWVWTYLGKATIKGATVELEAVLFADGLVATSYPTDRNPVGVPTDPTAVYVNPKGAPPMPPGVRQTDVQRYQRPSTVGGVGQWKQVGVDQSGKPVVGHQPSQGGTQQGGQVEEDPLEDAGTVNPPSTSSGC
ncbi:hypothetical protein [Actinokineospora sp. HUAS TT18]|uniref:hypothetical protein n=1 Tax=Actinokineospora sp. HUAS TT18 TaxID=3447451 RepID=UPI003F520C03